MHVYTFNIIAVAYQVKVERIVLAYGFTDLLVEIGSCLGLWLGLSVVGIFDLVLPFVAQICLWTKKFIKASMFKKEPIQNLPQSKP